jgi:hypothetical protein
MRTPYKFRYSEEENTVLIFSCLMCRWLQKEFLDKYATFLKLISKIYPDEKVTSVNEMRDILASL